MRSFTLRGKTVHIERKQYNRILGMKIYLLVNNLHNKERLVISLVGRLCGPIHTVLVVVLHHHHKHYTANAIYIEVAHTPYTLLFQTFPIFITRLRFCFTF